MISRAKEWKEYYKIQNKKTSHQRLNYRRITKSLRDLERNFQTMLFKPILYKPSMPTLNNFTAARPNNQNKLRNKSHFYNPKSSPSRRNKTTIGTNYLIKTKKSPKMHKNMKPTNKIQFKSNKNNSKKKRKNSIKVNKKTNNQHKTQSSLKNKSQGYLNSQKTLKIWFNWEKLMQLT